jgi:hypothetical protein
MQLSLPLLQLLQAVLQLVRNLHKSTAQTCVRTGTNVHTLTQKLPLVFFFCTQQTLALCSTDPPPICHHHLIREEGKGGGERGGGRVNPHLMSIGAGRRAEGRSLCCSRCQYMYFCTSKDVSICTFVLVKALRPPSGVSVCTFVLVKVSVYVLLY